MWGPGLVEAVTGFIQLCLVVVVEGELVGYCLCWWPGSGCSTRWLLFGLVVDADEADPVVHVHSALLTSEGAVGYLLPELAGEFVEELEAPATLVRRILRHLHVQTSDADCVLGEARGDVPGGGWFHDWAVSRPVGPWAGAV